MTLPSEGRVKRTSILSVFYKSSLSREEPQLTPTPLSRPFPNKVWACGQAVPTAAFIANSASEFSDIQTAEKCHHL